MRHINRGFTLVELLVALTVVGILAGLGMPLFQGVFERARVDTDTGEFVRALSMARLEAINRSASITLAPASGTSWNGVLDVKVGSTVLRKTRGMAPGATFSAGNTASLVFNSLGGLQSPSTAVTFSYSRASNSSYNRSITVCPTGRTLTGTSC